MDARKSQPAAGLKGLVARLDRRIIMVGSIVALLGIFGFASAQSHDPSSGPSVADALAAVPSATISLPSPTAVATATSKAHGKKTSVHLSPTVTVVAHAAASHPTQTPAVVATPSEAQTPLVLSDPTTLAAPVNTPWWQTALDVTWKLALVVGLIYLAMRVLAALKKHGFSTVNKGDRRQHFFEQIEEIQIAPQHSLHAVRAGDRILLLARTAGTLRTLGEIDATGEEGDALAAGGFNKQLMRAWAGILPPASQEAVDEHLTQTEPAVTLPDTQGTPVARAGVIDAQWVTVEATEDADDPPAALEPLPLRKGTARPSDKPAPPEQMDESTEREILYYAEEHSVSEAAQKFGLSRQRVTAMRARHERDRIARKQTHDRQQEGRKANVRAQANADLPRAKPTQPYQPALPTVRPDHPRGAASEPIVPLAARANLARNAYQNTPALPVKPVSKPAADEMNQHAITVGQVLAARFGIKFPVDDK